MSTYQLSYTGEKIQELLQKTDSINLNNFASTEYVNTQNTEIKTQLKEKQTKAIIAKATIPYTDWMQDDKGTYINFISIPKITEEDTNFSISPIYDEQDAMIRLNQQQAWNCVSSIISYNGYIKIICDKGAITYPIPITIQIIR